jgi:hypothetical protein
MTERDPPSGPRMDKPGQDKSARPDLGADMQGLARDWITVWQSELAASTVDRELQETWQRMLTLWAQAAGALVGGQWPGRSDAGRSRSPASPRATPAAAASDTRDAEIGRLAERVAELERRLAELGRDA